jgi:DNA-binding transcriptional regulator LsrR (DeoR family)
MTKIPKKISKAEAELFFYENACENLANCFVEKYFGKEAEYDWVAGGIGGVIEVADRFFDMQDIHEFLKNKYTSKMMFEYYDKKLDCSMKDEEWGFNIYSYKKLKK